MYQVVWDLETTNLKGFMATILCCSFKAVSPDMSLRPYTFRLDDSRFRNDDDPIDDSKLLIAIRDELEQYHCLIGWNSKAFDRHILNAKLLRNGDRQMDAQFHIDPMHYCQGIGSKALKNVQKFFGFPEAKTELEWDEWRRAALLDSKAMDEVVHHCEQDVIVTEMAYWRLLPRIKTIGK